jgi:class 3 adenylate cyclase
VDFGLDAIAVLKHINGEINQSIDESLHIKVGINIGGPIVVGVVGTVMPTSEFIGPALNMAQQMEHHGVAMNVDVSRAVYELMDGGTGAVKERSEITLKNGSALTYQVEKRRESPNQRNEAQY